MKKIENKNNTINEIVSMRQIAQMKDAADLLTYRVGKANDNTNPSVSDALVKMRLELNAINKHMERLVCLTRALKDATENPVTPTPVDPYDVWFLRKWGMLPGEGVQLLYKVLCEDYYKISTEYQENKNYFDAYNRSNAKSEADNHIYHEMYGMWKNNELSSIDETIFAVAMAVKKEKDKKAAQAQKKDMRDMRVELSVDVNMQDFAHFAEEEAPFAHVDGKIIDDVSREIYRALEKIQSLDAWEVDSIRDEVMAELFGREESDREAFDYKTILIISDVYDIGYDMVEKFLGTR